MFSEKQLASIVAEVIGKVLPEDFDEIMESFTLDEATLNIGKQVDFLEDAQFEGNLFVDAWDYIIDGNDKTLQEALDEKLENPTELSGIEDTFSSTPTGNQLPEDNKSNLTAEEEEALFNNALYWIKRGYIKINGTDVYKITTYSVEDTFLSFSTQSLELDSNGGINSAYCIYVVINKSTHSYNYTEINI